jgi:hypothetical protein
MSDAFDPVLSAVLALSPEERVQLADHLLEKLQSGGAEIDPAELVDRIEVLRSGDPERLQELREVVRA